MIARIIEACARNRGLVLLGVGISLLAALWSIRTIKLDAIPDLSDPQVILYSEWMGRSPTLVEDQVTYPIVSALVSAPRVADVRGYSMFGMSFVYVIFEEGTDLYWARGRIQEYLPAIRERLPAGVSPVLGPDADATGWVFQYTLEDRRGRHRIDELRAFQDFTLRYALGSVPGVSEVASVGGYQRQYQVQVSPERLRAHDLSIQDVIASVRESNSDVGGRVIEFSGREYFVRGRGYIQDLGGIERIALRARGPGGTPLLVRDVATVRFGPDIRRGLLEWNGDGEAVGGIVVMRRGENALQVIDRIKAKLAELEPSLPPGVEVVTAYDRSALIERSIDTLRGALIEEAVVVSLVILLFLLHVRSALLPIVSLPVAVAIAFIPMRLLDIPSTIMSLGGIAIAIGATVDAEIVMVEASHKKLEHAPPGADRRQLLAEAAAEVTPAIFFSLLIIAVSFLPVFTLTGQAGRLFQPLAFTKTFVMLAAALLSITFAPALRDVLLRGRIVPEARHPVSQLVIKLYRPFVYVALRRPISTVAIGLLALASAVPPAMRLGREFMPPLNEGDVLYMPTTFPGISIEQAKQQLQRMDRALREVPEVESVFGKVGRAETATDPAPLTMVETTIRLKPREQWRLVPRERWYSGWAPTWLRGALGRVWPEHTEITWEELTAEMDGLLQLPGWAAAWTMPIRARNDMLATGVRTPVGIKVLGADLQTIELIGAALERVVHQVPGTRSALFERNTGGMYLDVIPDHDALARYGLRIADVQGMIETAVGGTPITLTIEGRNRFSVNVRYPQDARADLEALRRILIPIRSSGPAAPGDPGGAGPMGAMAAAVATGAGAAPGGRAFVTLGEVARLTIATGPPMLRNEDGLLVGLVYVDIDPRRDIGGYVDDAKARVAAALASGELKLPAGYLLRWTGQYELMAQMAARMKVVIPATLLIIVLLLYLQFRNFTEVLIVLLSIPFALVGSVWLLWLLDYRTSTAVWVGFIALVGLAAQTGIVMIVYIDQAYERRRRAGLIRNLDDIIWAHLEGTVMRVRPKLMTVTTMLVGLIPLLWATGSGADVMKRIAAPMVGGLITSAFLTLEIIPVIYTYWRQEQLVWARLAATRPRRRRALAAAVGVLGAGLLAGLAVGLLWLYLELPPWIAPVILWGGGALCVGGLAAYLILRPNARRLLAAPV